MKQVRLLVSPLALGLMIASTSWACDKDHNTSAAAAGTSSKSHACSAEMMAACQSKGAATTASAVHCPGMMGVALNLDASAQSASNKADCCVSKSASAVTADNMSGCSAHGASATTAVNTTRSRTMLAGASGQCSGHMSSSASAHSMHADCDACADMADCEAELQSAGVRVQTVPLKNGLMFVYTASSPGKVSALQSSLARRTERLNQLVSAGAQAHLCAECKAMRGAMASGRLTREVVNIEGGALTLMTSNDPAMVSKIYAMVDMNPKVARKS
jgi:hypothetical protein